jgi:adenylate cyclase
VTPPPAVEKRWQGKHGLDCYLKYLQPLKYRRTGTIEGLRAAWRIAQEITELCPEASEATHTLAAVLYHGEYWIGSDKSPQECIEKGMEMAHQALAINDSNSTAHGVLSHFYLFRREYDEALAEGERAVALAPGGEFEHFSYAETLRYVGRWEEAIVIYQEAMRLSPLTPPGVFNGLGGALFRLGRYEEAASALRKAIQLAPKNFMYHINLAALYSLIGQDHEARAEAAEALRLNPKFSVDSWARLQPHRDPSAMDKYSDALRKAGLK